MYQLQLVICNDALQPQIFISDMLRLDCDGNIEGIGRLVARIPLRYEQQLDALGLLQNVTNQPNTMPQFTAYVLAKHKGCENFLFGGQAYIIDRPTRVLDSDGTKVIEITASDGTSLLSYRGHPFNSDLAQSQFNEVQVSDALLAIVNTAYTNQGFGAARDWIAAGTIQNTIVAGLGAINWSPKVAYKASLLSIFQDAQNFSRTNNAPIFFRVRPTINNTALGETPALPWVVEVFADQIGLDRCFGNAAGNPVVNFDSRAGNVASFELGPDWTDDYSVSFVGGQNTGAARVVAPGGAPAISAARVASSRYGWRESVSTVTDLTTPQQAADRQSSNLAEGTSRSRVTIETTIASTTRFGGARAANQCGNFDIGDKVSFSNQRFKGGPTETVCTIVKAFLLSAEGNVQALNLTLEPDRIAQ